MPSLVTGLGGAIGFGEGFLQANDDRSTGAINVSSVFGSGGLYFNGAHYSTLYVNNNGNITFGSPLASDTPSAFGQGANAPLIIAPYWMDLDTRGPHETSAGPPPNTSPGGTSQGSNFVWFDVDAEHKVFTATWDDVGYAASDQNNNPAAFQVQLIAAGDPGDFDIVFNYEWTGPAPADQPNIAYAGYSLGHAASGATSVQITASGDAAGMALIDTNPGNTGIAGYYVWHIRGGVLHVEAPDPHTGGGDPPPGGGGGDPPPGGGGGDPPPGGGDPPPGGGGGDPPPGGGDPPPDHGGGDPPPPDTTIDPEPEEPPKPTYSVSFGVAMDGMVREGDSGATPYHITILRVGEDIGSPSYVDWQIDIADPSDLVPGQALSGTAVFGIGQREVVIPVAVQGDKVFEPDEQFLFKLTNAIHGLQVFNPAVSSFGLIVNDDAPVVFDFSGPQIRAEGLSGVTPFDFTVIRTGDLREPSIVQWSLEPGTADGLDFAPDQPLAGQVRFAAGESQAVIQIRVAGDVKPEPDESFTLRLTSAATGTATTTPTAATTGTILDDDVRHSLLVATPTALVLPEGNAGATAFAYTVLRTGDLSAEVKIPYAVALQAGGIGADEIQGPMSGFVTFAPGAAEAMLTVLIGGDTTPEDNESFSVTLGGGAFNSLTLSGVVMNDDEAGGGGSASVAGRGAPDGDTSSFVQHLMGGSLWGGAGGI